jgi:hypothetical protein
MLANHPLMIEYELSRHYSSENELFRVFNDPERFWITLSKIQVSKQVYDTMWLIRDKFYIIKRTEKYLLNEARWTTGNAWTFRTNDTERISISQRQRWIIIQQQAPPQKLKLTDKRRYNSHRKTSKEWYADSERQLCRNYWFWLLPNFHCTLKSRG